MRVLLSKPVQEKLARPESLLRFSIENIVKRLESIGARGLEKNSSVRRLSDTTEEIYVMRANNLRVFFTKKDKDIVVLSIQNG